MLEINNLIMYDAVRPQWGFLGERLRALFIPQYKFAKISSAVLLRKLVQNCTGIGEMDIVCAVTFILGSPRHSLDFELLYLNHHIFSWYVLSFLLISTCLLFCLREYP